MQKTKKSVAKRFKLSARGKLMRRTPGFRHLLAAKTTKTKTSCLEGQSWWPKAMPSRSNACLPFGL